MSVLKGLANAVLGFLLFLSLSIFGMAFLLNSTLLNADFVTDQIDKIEVAELAREFTGDRTEEISREIPFIDVEEIINDIITEYEPWLKEQVNTAIRTGYAYFKGETDLLVISVPLGELKEDLKESLWTSVKDNLKLEFSNLPEDILQPFLDEYYDDFAEQTLSEYLPGDIANLPEDELRPYLEQYLQEFTGEIPLEILSSSISTLIDDLLRQNFDEFYDEFTSEIPSVITTDDIPDDIQEHLVTARKYMGWVQTGYYALIGFMVLLALGIILVNRSIKDATRSLGISLLIYGALQFGGTLVAKTFLPKIELPLDIPVAFETWLTGLYTDLLAPMQTLGLGILISGVILIVVSIVYRPRKTSD